MLDRKLPPQLQYQRIQPKGYASIFRQWINDPMTGNKTWATNDIVRFNFMNSKKGVFDPYRSFIEITVSCDIASLPCGLLQVDNSAHSFINQFVLYSNSRQIERITQYGTLLAYLNDIGLNQFLSQGRQTQGLGYGSFDTMPFPRQSSSISVPRRQNNSNDLSATFSLNTIYPTIGNAFPQQIQYLWNNSLYNCSKGAKGHVSNSNVIFTKNDKNGGGGDTQNKTGIQACIYNVGWANNLRTDYLTPYISSKYPQHTQSIPSYQLGISYATTAGQFPYKYQTTKPYLPYVRSNYYQKLYFDSTHTQQNHYINSSNFGFGNLFSPLFTRGTFQPFISPTVPQSLLQSGQLLRTKVPIYRRKFKIPLASAVMGALIDTTNYFLIPLQSINQCLLEITLDPYAMFTSGYNDYCQFDDIGMSSQQKRTWNIDRIQYKIHTYYFVDNQVQQFIKSSLYKQITTVNQFWSLSNQYQVPGHSPVNNSYIVGCSSSSLDSLVCLFVSNDYQVYSFCRKHFRLSNCIRRFWSKLATDYWPPQPFKGNSGNVTSNNIDDDNAIFIENIYWQNNYMFQRNSLPRINPYNFAVNSRPYDPTNRNTFYDPNMLDNQSYSFTPNSVNCDTALGMPYIHQNRLVGKAAFVIVYTPFHSQQNLLNGINVSGLSNFQVVFQQDQQNAYSRDQTLYIFCRSSVIVKYTQQGIKTIGR